MRKIVVEESGEGLQKLMGQHVTLFCMNYIYAGDLIGVNDTCVLLQNAKIVFDTGAFSNKDWATAESLPGDWYVQTAAIESFGVLKK